MSGQYLQWASASLTLPGQVECGDHCIVTDSANGTLVAVVDGLGHGPEAARAATQAIAAISDGTAGRHLGSVFRHCHALLRDTRGVVMSVALFTPERTMTWMGVGDVEGRLVRHDPSGFKIASMLPLGAGVVGERLPGLAPVSVGLIRNDVLVLATDGISGEFTLNIPMHRAPQEIADDIIARYGRYTDDALVFVARYTG